MSESRLNAAQVAAVTELLRIAPVADRLGELFEAAGHEFYLVGGSVRDALLGRLQHDLDFTTSARPDDVEALLRRFSPSVWTIGKEFGTVGCKVVEDGVPWVIEVTTFRSDAYAPTAANQPWRSVTRWKVTSSAATSPSTRWRCPSRARRSSIRTAVSPTSRPRRSGPRPLRSPRSVTTRCG